MGADLGLDGRAASSAARSASFSAFFLAGLLAIFATWNGAESVWRLCRSERGHDMSWVLKRVDQRKRVNEVGTEITYQVQLVWQLLDLLY